VQRFTVNLGETARHGRRQSGQNAAPQDTTKPKRSDAPIAARCGGRSVADPQEELELRTPGYAKQATAGCDLGDAEGFSGSLGELKPVFKAVLASAVRISHPAICPPVRGRSPLLGLSLVGLTQTQNAVIRSNFDD